MATLAELVRTTNRTIRRYPYILWFVLFGMILDVLTYSFTYFARLGFGILPGLVLSIWLILGFYLTTLFQNAQILYGLTSQSITPMPRINGILQASKKAIGKAIMLNLLFAGVYFLLVLLTIELPRSLFQNSPQGSAILVSWNYILLGIVSLGSLFSLCVLLQERLGVLRSALEGCEIILKNIPAIFPVALVALLTYAGIIQLQGWGAQAVESALAAGEGVVLIATLRIVRLVLFASNSLLLVYFTVLFSIFYVQLTKEGSPS